MAPLKIYFGVQANLFESERRQEKVALASTKADFLSLSEFQNLLLTAQEQLLELVLINYNSFAIAESRTLLFMLSVRTNLF
jgi:hypothetical protein